MKTFFIQVQWYPSSLSFEHILSLATAFQRCTVKQWDFEREKVFDYSLQKKLEHGSFSIYKFNTCLEGHPL